MIFPIDPIERTGGLHNPPDSGEPSPEKSDADNNRDDEKDTDKDSIEISKEGRAAAEEYQKDQNTDKE